MQSVEVCYLCGLPELADSVGEGLLELEKKVSMRLGKALDRSKSLKERLERLWELLIAL